jgi:hypothetical protein
VNNNKFDEFKEKISNNKEILYELNEQGVNLLNYCIDNNKINFCKFLIEN